LELYSLSSWLRRRFLASWLLGFLLDGTKQAPSTLSLSLLVLQNVKQCD
jgi:hypothetical protein